MANLNRNTNDPNYQNPQAKVIQSFNEEAAAALAGCQLSLEVQPGSMFPHVVIRDGDGGQVIVSARELVPLGRALLKAAERLRQFELLTRFSQRARNVLRNSGGGD